MNFPAHWFPLPWLLAADVLGRVVNPPAEVQAALMCALLGAPLFIGLARARRGVQL